MAQAFGDTPANGPGPQLTIPWNAPLTLSIWSNMPAALSLWMGIDGFQTAVDLTNFSQVRFVVSRRGAGGSVAGSKLYVRYVAGGAWDGTPANYLQIGASSVEVDINVGAVNTILDTGWINLAAGAKGLSTIAVLGEGGDGAADPQFGPLFIHFR